MKCFTASPDLGATLAYVPLGMEIERSVLAMPLPLAGIVQSYALHCGGKCESYLGRRGKGNRNPTMPKFVALYYPSLYLTSVMGRARFFLQPWCNVDRQKAQTMVQSKVF